MEKGMEKKARIDVRGIKVTGKFILWHLLCCPIYFRNLLPLREWFFRSQDVIGTKIRGHKIHIGKPKTIRHCNVFDAEVSLHETKKYTVHISLCRAILFMHVLNGRMAEWRRRSPFIEHFKNSYVCVYILKLWCRG